MAEKNSWMAPLLTIGGLGVLAWFLLRDSGTSGGSGGGAAGGDSAGGGGSGNKNAVNGGPNVGTGTPTRVTSAPYVPPTPVFVEAGPATPITFWPIGQGVISTSRPIDAAEQAKVLTNLANSGIQNAWWTEPTVTNPQNWGINSGGSPQSDIPSGVKHCAGPGPGAPATDTWHYC